MINFIGLISLSASIWNSLIKFSNNYIKRFISNNLGTTIGLSKESDAKHTEFQSEPKAKSHNTALNSQKFSSLEFQETPRNFDDKLEQSRNGLSQEFGAYQPLTSFASNLIDRNWLTP